MAESRSGNWPKISALNLLQAEGVLAKQLDGWTPLLAAAPFAGFLVRALWAVREPRPVPDIKRFGFTHPTWKQNR